MLYSRAVATALAQDAATVRNRYEQLLLAYTRHQFADARAAEFASNGLARRVKTLSRCIENTFSLLPPGDSVVPERESLIDATINIHAFIFNLCGCLDNLAWIWVCEKVVRAGSGKSLSGHRIGLSPKYSEVRESLPNTLLERLGEFDPWIAFLEGFRHALAHRIPPYIPPYTVPVEHEAEYRRLASEALRAALCGEFMNQNRLEEQQKALARFKPLMTHSFGEKAPFSAIHAQMLVDFLTIESLANAFMTEMTSSGTAAAPKEQSL